VSPFSLCVCGRDVDQRLLVPTLNERHRFAQLIERLAESGHVAMAENAKRGRYESALLTVVTDRILARQIDNNGLRDCESHGAAVSCSHEFRCSRIQPVVPKI
jgi:hypothetical protein